MRRPGVRGSFVGLEVVWRLLVVVVRHSGPWGCRGVLWVSFGVVGLADSVKSNCCRWLEV